MSQNTAAHYTLINSLKAIQKPHIINNRVPFFIGYSPLQIPIFSFSFMQRIFYAFIWILFIPFLANAQHDKDFKGVISGRIIDSTNKQAVEYATIGLINQADDKVVNGTTTDSVGFFKLTNLPNGAYKINIEFIGYSKRSKENIVLNNEHPIVDLKTITLINKQNTLKGVTIIAEKNIFENKIDKMVYNVERDVTSQGGVAADVLKKVPEVSVDVDGNVELQGNSNIRFLINGKPSILFGNNVADVLQTIPSSRIKSIEVITSPGARYDAEGTGGIINIILKESKAEGMNGNVSLSASSRLENGSINMNMRHGNFGINAYLSGNAQISASTINRMDRTNYDSASSTHLLQNGNSDFYRYGYQSGIGFDWDVSPKNNISGNLSYNTMGNSNVGWADRNTLIKDGTGITLSNMSDAIATTNQFHQNIWDLDLNYRKKFNQEDRELSVEFHTTKGNLYSNYDQAQKQLIANDWMVYNSSKGNNPGIEDFSYAALNYTQPLPHNIVFETGFKSQIDHYQSNSDVYLFNTTTQQYDYSTNQSFATNYSRVIHAAYASVNFKLRQLLDIKAGLRDEYTTVVADFSNAGNVNVKPYNTLVPSLMLAHNFPNKQTLKLAYTHRIERPEFRDLNPFYNVSDPRNITTGNPSIRPELGDKIELSFNRSFKKETNLTATVFYRGNRDDIQPYTRYYSSFTIGDSTYQNVAITARENIGREDNYGLSLFGSLSILEKLTLRSNISYFDRYIYTGISSKSDVHGTNYRANLNISYQVNKTLITEFFGNFNSPRVNAQGTMPAFTTYNFALRKQLFHKNGSIALTATNFFNKYVNQDTHLTGENFTLSNSRQLPYRSFGINFTYKFGKMVFKPSREEEDVNLTSPPGI